MNAVGCITSKMVAKATLPVSYELSLGSTLIPMNAFIDKNITLKFSGKITCIHCKKAIKKSYHDGFCFPCTQKLAQCDLCVMKPERCHFYLNTCREPEWGLAHCMIPHIVYLSNTTGVKVGITRHHQIPTRWIDQGAIQAIPLFKVPTRRISGFVEVAIAKHISDATQWRKLIQQHADKIDLSSIAKKVYEDLDEDINALKKQWGEDAIVRVKDAQMVELEYPIIAYPNKCVTLSLDKTSEINGKLLGIKGQYLFFEHGALNIRKHQGYEIDIG